MKQLLLLLLLTLGISINQTVAVVGPTKATAEKEMMEKAKDFKSEWKSLSKKERKTKRKAARKAIKNAKKAKKAGEVSDTTLLVLIAIFIPFLAVGLYDGITNRFWISLLLTLLFWLPGFIYALIVILE